MYVVCGKIKAVKNGIAQVAEYDHLKEIGGDTAVNTHIKKAKHLMNIPVLKYSKFRKEREYAYHINVLWNHHKDV